RGAAAFARGREPPPERARAERPAGHDTARRRLSAGSGSGPLPGGHVHAHHAGEGRSPALAHRAAGVPRRGLALLRRLCIAVSRRSRARHHSRERAQVKTHVRVLVIGGGVVGVSTLYHLTRKGWTDVALIERTELTAGSTWHAAGLLPLFNMSYTVGQLHKYSVDLYKRLPAETGQDVSFHVTGNLRLATCRERMDEYQKYCGTANTIGVPFEVIGPARVKELWPLSELGGSADTPAVIGALYHPHDGHIAPADLTIAPDKSYYLREERMGWILGPYERGAPARFADGVPDWFGRSLFPGDLDRLVPHVEAATRRVPALEHCGIKDIVNGPIPYAPDGSPLIGPAWGMRNVWINEGHSFGITAAGGAGWQLAEWIVEGEPGIDMLGVDPRRFGAYTSKRYLVQKNEETYRN